MKLRNKLAAITAAAMLAFTGVGFAAWAFTTERQDTADAAALVTCAMEANNVKVYNGDDEIENIYLIFDAPITATTERRAGHGIFFSSTNDGANEITTLRLVGQIDHPKHDLHYADSNEKVVFGVNEVNGLPSAHVNFTAGSIANAEQPIVADDNEYEAVYTLPTYSYVSAPNSMADLETFYNAVHDTQLDLTFTFNIKA